MNYAEYLSSLGVLHLGFPFKELARPRPYLIQAEKLDENKNEAISSGCFTLTALNFVL